MATHPPLTSDDPNTSVRREARAAAEVAEPAMWRHGGGGGQARDAEQGMAGLATARELQREGHAVTVMEQRGNVGGQWLYDPAINSGDPLGATAAPVKVHGSMYTSVRLLSPCKGMGVSDFQFLPSAAVGHDGRRFPSHARCTAAVRLNTRVVRVAMAPPSPPRGGGGGYSDVKWQVRSVRVEQESSKGATMDEEFNAVVMANGHYSQPRLPTINGPRCFTELSY